MDAAPDSAYLAAAHRLIELHAAGECDRLRVRIEPFVVLMSEAERERIARLAEFLEGME